MTGKQLSVTILNRETENSVENNTKMFFFFLKKKLHNIQHKPVGVDFAFFHSSVRTKNFQYQMTELSEADTGDRVSLAGEDSGESQQSEQCERPYHRVEGVKSNGWSQGQRFDIGP